MYKLHKDKLRDLNFDELIKPKEIEIKLSRPKQEIQGKQEEAKKDKIEEEVLATKI